MVRTALAAADPDEPDHAASNTRPHLGVVPGTPDPGDLDADRFAHLVFTAADAQRLPASARHRIAAYIHLQLATLEEFGDTAESAEH
ncbi:hypothetical protein [Nocardia otitidiscaviarum]|uniref:hypothetical protein n=1 Tax=Nocardia otitidiscaviarum TaxID=1823 RepID=UPI0018942BD7|nr:hypothetical protein [Nocardia otitidiscaviarum]MBF6179999.1 hypothetical protein [Nocardia otitidiscaviarum]